ncbi:hypothetical protein Q9233_011727 [Columba guinea]|nr:hypothetical protein Q9233_011727 [Columba guinea]
MLTFVFWPECSALSWENGRGMWTQPVPATYSTRGNSIRRTIESILAQKIEIIDYPAFVKALFFILPNGLCFEESFVIAVDEFRFMASHTSSLPVSVIALQRAKLDVNHNPRADRMPYFQEGNLLHSSKLFARGSLRLLVTMDALCPGEDAAFVKHKWKSMIHEIPSSRKELEKEGHSKYSIVSIESTQFNEQDTSLKHVLSYASESLYLQYGQDT